MSKEEFLEKVRSKLKIKLKKAPDISKLINRKYEPLEIDDGLRYYNDRDKIERHNEQQQASIYAQLKKRN